MKALLLLFVLLCTTVLTAQRLTVESYFHEPNTLSASVNAVTDVNGRIAALIIVRSSLGDLRFESNGGVVKTIDKPEGIWVYVQGNEQRLTIICEGYLPKDFELVPRPQPGNTYILEVTGVMEDDQGKTIDSQWLVITAQPSSAIIYLNDEFAAVGTYQKNMEPGIYKYRIEADLYYPEEGAIELTLQKREELNINLLPNHGFVQVTTLPEEGARILINKRDGDFLSNNRSKALKSGKYLVTAIKEFFSQASDSITIFDGQTSALTLQMQPTFAQINIDLPEDAMLYINNQQTSKGSWAGRLSAGIYTFEARMNNHDPAIREIKLEKGEEVAFILTPKPITGSLSITTIPVGASISLNGKVLGESPISIDSIIQGEYLLRVDKTGYSSWQKSILITKNSITPLQVTLPEATKNIRVLSRPENAQLFINKNYIGKTPLDATVQLGPNEFMLQKDDKQLTEKINIEFGGKADYFFDLEKEVQTEDVARPDRMHTANVVFELDVGENNAPNMIFVKGGSFTMGCENRSTGPKCDPVEKPAHKVTLSDFSISETEITIEQYASFISESGYKTTAERLGYAEKLNEQQQIVKVANASWRTNEDGKIRPKTDWDYPVVFVNWDDAMAYCDWLSKQTGKKYRLPTEAEWEYAAKGGTKSKAYVYAGSNNPQHVAVSVENSGLKQLNHEEVNHSAIAYNQNSLKKIRQKSPNELGIYDMSGNVWEWCLDWFGNYEAQEQINPIGQQPNKLKAVRGGSWMNPASAARLTFRAGIKPKAMRGTLGFRIVSDVASIK